MLNLFYLKSSRLKVLHFLAWFMHWQQGGEVWAWNGLLDAFRRFSCGFEPLLGSVAHRSDPSRSPVWPVRSAGSVHMLHTSMTGGVDRSDRSGLSYCSCLFQEMFCMHSSPVVWIGLTGQGWVVAATLFQVMFCMHSSRGSCIDSGGACMCAGGALCGFSRFGLVACALCLSIVFLVCVESLPFKWSCSLPLFGFWSLVRVSFYSFLFFFFSLVLVYVGVVNALIKGEIEDHVWFEDQWMIASLCDEWLTTLCGLILG
jgi:hypothetical protein